MSAETGPDAVLRAARRDPWLRHSRAKMLHLTPTWIYLYGEVVGVLYPRRVGAWVRLGPVFVLPDWRGRGLAEMACAGALDALPGPAAAHIEIGNIGSEALFRRLGFSDSGLRVRQCARWVRP